MYLRFLERAGSGDGVVSASLLTPTTAEVEDVARRPAASIERIAGAIGRNFEPVAVDAALPELTPDDLGLAACCAAARAGDLVSGDRRGLPTLGLVFPPEPPPRGADIGPLADDG